MSKPATADRIEIITSVQRRGCRTAEQKARTGDKIASAEHRDWPTKCSRDW